MDEARPGKSPLGPVAGVLLGTALLGLGGCLVFGGVAVMEDLLGRTTFLVAGICFLLLGILAVGIGIFRSCWKDSAAQKPPLEQRAERLGQPTEPEAYQDGGLAVAATAYSVEEAQLIASVLRSEGIPAWVRDANIAGWYWHAQIGLQHGGIPVTVPLGRLAEVRCALGKHRMKKHSPVPASEQGEEQGTAIAPDAGSEKECPEEPEAAAALAPDPEFEQSVTGARLRRSAKMLLVLSVLLPYVAPLYFYGAVRVRREIRGAQQRRGPAKELRSAMRMATAALFISGSLTSVLAIGIGIGIVAIVAKFVYSLP